MLIDSFDLTLRLRTPTRTSVNKFTHRTLLPVGNKFLTHYHYHTPLLERNALDSAIYMTHDSCPVTTDTTNYDE